MAKNTTLTVNVAISGARETLAAFRGLPKDASTQLREASLELSRVIAEKAAAAGVAHGSQARLLATTVKAVRDRVPAVQVGGARRLGRNRAPAWALLFASEFGMDRRSGWYAATKYNLSFGEQANIHRGRSGYWFFPTVEAEAATIAREWNDAADRILKAFGGGGRG